MILEDLVGLVDPLFLQGDKFRNHLIEDMEIIGVFLEVLSYKLEGEGHRERMFNLAGIEILHLAKEELEI